MSTHTELDPYTAKAENHDVTTQVKIRGKNLCAAEEIQRILITPLIDLRELVDSVRTAMLTTRSPEGQLHSRAMALARAGMYSEVLSSALISDT